LAGNKVGNVTDLLKTPAAWAVDAGPVDFAGWRPDLQPDASKGLLKLSGFSERA
jgi:hypothetical protein